MPSARIVLTTVDSRGQTNVQTQTVYAGDSYLSQSTKWLHFGLGAGTSIQSVVVRWPSGENSLRTESIQGVQANGRFVVRYGTGNAEPAEVRGQSPQLAATTPAPAVDNQHARLWLSTPTEPVSVTYTDADKQRQQLTWPNDVDSNSASATLLVFWASWCSPCLQELSELAAQASTLQDAGLRIVALNIEALEEDADQAFQDAKDAMQRLKFPHTWGLADEATLQRVDQLRHQVLYRQDALPLPSSCLLDGQGRIRTFYSGPVEVDTVLEDRQHLNDSDEQSLVRSVPFAGRWSNRIFVTNPIAIADVYRQEGQFDDAAEYLERYLTNHPEPPASNQTQAAATERFRLADVHYFLARLAQAQQQDPTAHLQQAIALNPRLTAALVDLSDARLAAKQLPAAGRLLEQALAQRPGDANVHNKLGVVRLQQNEISSAIAQFQLALQANSRWYPAANNLAWLRATHPDAQYRNGAEAVRMAERILRESNSMRPDFLDTLAAALAEVGQFDQAVRVAAKAIELADSAHMTELADKLRLRQQQYSAGQPYRDSSFSADE
ncbi:MAG: ASPIC/UnbV domain-containing protein [Pirellulaceae bacterium]